MNYHFVPMTRAYATTIVENWKYEGEYAIYDYSLEAEHMLDEESWGRGVFAVLDEQGKLAAELSIEFLDEQGDYTDYRDYRDRALVNRRELWVGFGLRPDLVGQGRGAEFVAACVEFAVRQCGYGGEYARLGVAGFNRRAMRAYEKAGFQEYGRAAVEVDGQALDFVHMRKRLSVVEPGSEG